MKNRMNDIFYVFRREFYTVFRDHAVLTFFILLSLAYPLVYTYIYSEEVVREVPVAVVDHSQSSLSREFLRLWDASANVHIVSHCSDIEEAKELMYQKKIYGILEIPADFNKELNQGDQAHIALFCDMGILLNYKALLMAASDVSIGMGKQIQVKGMAYASRIQQQIVSSPVRVEEVKLFNSQSGFASFIIPAVLVLVVQQSLLLGVGTIAGTARDRSPRRRMIPNRAHYQRAWCVVVGKGCLYALIYFFMSFWVFFIVPRIFNLTQISSKGELMLFLFPFLLACVFLSIAASFLSKEREQPFLIFVFTSIPLMFISGISWPREGIPDYWIAFSKLFPSTYGIDGFVKINNMGATLQEVTREYVCLWILAAVYFGLACLLYRREIRKMNP
ncbi:MAG: ABC transporter permease [Odoribacter sp.]